MHWVLQNNIYSEEGWDVLVSALDRLALPYSVHKVIPFSDGAMDPEPSLPDGSRAIVMGSYTLAKSARTRGWIPGAFLDNLEFEIQRKHWGTLMLNHDAAISRFDSVAFQKMPFFLRPVHDTKSFTGFVCDWPFYAEWLKGVLKIAEFEVSLLTPSTPVMVCKSKEIWTETRTWIVDGKVVTASGYKFGTIKRYSTPEQVDPEIVAFAQRCANIWNPNRAYVLDVAETPNGLRIVEVNNLNSAGWYKADVQKILMSLEESFS